MTRKEEIEQAAYTHLAGDKSYSTEYEHRGFIAGAEWADKNPNPQAIAEFLHKEKGYSITLNGEISTFEEAMKDAQIYNAYMKKQMIEKAVEWLGNFYQYKLGYRPFEEVIEDFKQAMEK